MKKYIAFILSMALAVSMLASCGNKENTEDKTAGTSSQTSVSEELTADETTASAGDFFGDDYDPFADDYDPYGDNAENASNVVVTAATAAGDDESDNDTAAEDNSSDRQEVPQAPTSPVTTTAKPDNTVKTASADDTKPETTSAKAETAANKSESSAASNGISLTLNTANGWNDGTTDYVQIDGSVKNEGDGNVSGWTVTITVGSGVSVDQSWNCNLSTSGGKITVTPVDYNTDIFAGGEATFGMILKNASSVDPSKATLKCGTVTAAGTGNGGGNNNDNSSGVGNNNPKIVAAKDVPEPTTDDWLSVKGNKIVDKDGKEVWLTGCNWFGYNTGTNTFDGLWACDLNTSIAQIADHGFNLLRVPISTELIKSWSNGSYPTANFNQATNSYLVGMNSLEIFDYVVGQCRANGLKIMIDIHCAKTDSMGHMKALWTDGNISEKDYLDTLAWMAKRYKNDDTIIAFDLENEPHGKPSESPRAKWDNSTDSDNWKYIAEKAAKSVLKQNPNVLVMVEGIEIYPIDIKKNGDFSSTNSADYYFNWWGGNLRGVKDNPIDLGKYQNKLVYSPHDYGPAVYQQPWFKSGYNYNSLYNDCWHDNWFYIQEEGIAPLLIGEWGGFMTEPNLTWMTHLRTFIKKNKINHTFWCFNANSGDTGGLVKDDFVTWDTEKYNFVKEVLWQENGKFVGLDHEIPLGKNGITLSDKK
ncbi:MAG: cellulase family glycosylhydrolase [Oscillospiraceae bacterium]